MNAEYLKEAVGKYLCQALCAVARRRPERPIEFLAYYLIALYEKDLELQRAEEASKKAAEQKEDEKPEDLPVTPGISQIFHRRLSVALPQEAECASPTPSSSSVVSEVPPEISHMFKERLSISGSQEKRDVTSLPISPTVVVSTESEPSVIPEKPEISLTSADIRKPSLLKEVRLELPRKISSVQEPVTAEEAEQFGTTDPFLARRPSSNVFDVNASPIGNL